MVTEALKAEVAKVRSEVVFPWSKINGPLGPSSSFASMGYTCPRCRGWFHTSAAMYHDPVRCLARKRRGYQWETRARCLQEAVS